MRSLFAALRSLVLPFGATSGRRIVLDGVNGIIQIYRANDTLAVQLGGLGIGSGASEDSISFSTGDVDEDFAGQLRSFISGSGATRNLVLSMIPPAFTTAVDFPSFAIRSNSQDATTDPTEFVMDHDAPQGRLRCPALIGEATLVAGTVTVSRTTIRASGSSRIFLTVRTPGGTPGFLSTTRVVGTSFTIVSSSATDTSTVEWLILDE